MPTHRDVLDTPEILDRLCQLGYFGDKTYDDIKNISGKRLQRAVREYQAFTGLDRSGHVDARTASWMNRRRCGLPDMQLREPGSVCQWPMKRVQYFTQLKLPGITPSQASQAFDLACQQWTSVCGIELLRTTESRKAQIVARSGLGRKHLLDDRGGTLGWSEMPCQATRETRLRMMFDEAEEWSFNMAVAVLGHEIGHALGLPHGVRGSLMCAYYDPNITKPQHHDIREIVNLYGKTKTVPGRLVAAAPDRTATAAAAAAVIDISGTILINGQPYVLVPKT